MKNINMQNRSKYIFKLLGLVSLVLILFVAVSNKIGTSTRDDHVKNLEAQFVLLSERFKKDGYSYSRLYDGTVIFPKVGSDASTCFDSDISGTSCEPFNVNVRLTNNKKVESERTKIVELLKSEEFENVSDELTNSFLSTSPNDMSSDGVSPIYNLWMKKDNDKTYINVKYVNDEIYDVSKYSSDPGVVSSLTVNLYDFSYLKERNKQSWLEINLK